VACEVVRCCEFRSRARPSKPRGRNLALNLIGVSEGRVGCGEGCLSHSGHNIEIWELRGGGA